MFGWMTDPVIVPRAGHPISRRDIDPDALKVLYRLQQFDHTAYLVGGSVRDLLLGRRPKDFDVGTSAHPYQIKKLFRNCWIIGRRFRLAHVRFGTKAIEVATFRRNLTADEGLPLTPDPHLVEPPHAPPERGHRAPSRDEGDDLQIRHDNTFGTPEEDAFRRDFTINALFYDIATFAIIDYVGGLEDLKHRLIRSIGDPDQRFREDPVRMLRAISFAARLEFDLDAPVADAISKHRQLLATAAPARLVEEFYKILRSGTAEHTFRLLAQHGLLGVVSPELQRGSGRGEMWRALSDLDTYRRRFDSTPASLSNSVLIGSLLVPLGLMPRRDDDADDVEDDDDSLEAGNRPASAQEDRAELRRGLAGAPFGRAGGEPGAGNRANRDEAGSEALARGRGGRYRTPKPPVLKVGILPIARRDSERLRQILSLQRRLADLQSSPRAKRALMFRGPFDEAMTWLDVHGHVPEVVEHWRGFIEAMEAEGHTRPAAAAEAADALPAPDGPRRRRRRRRRRFRGRGPKT